MTGEAQTTRFTSTSAIKKTLRDPDSYRFISATRWAQDGSKAWVCKATYRVENGFGEYAIPEETDVIFDANGCRVLNPVSDKNTSTMTAAERREMNRQIKQVHELVKGSKRGGTLMPECSLSRPSTELAYADFLRAPLAHFLTGHSDTAFASSLDRHHRFQVSFESIERVVVERRMRRHMGVSGFIERGSVTFFLKLSLEVAAVAASTANGASAVCPPALPMCGRKYNCLPRFSGLLRLPDRFRSSSA